VREEHVVLVAQRDEVAWVVVAMVTIDVVHF
jgi:hypothetical protein